MVQTKSDAPPGYGTGAYLKKPNPAPSWMQKPKPAAKPAAAPAPKPAPAPAPQPSYYGGGGSVAAAPSPAPAPVAAPPPPAPMKDIDWFNSDSVYRGQAGKALTDLTSQLAQILADRDSGYQQLDTARDDLGRNRREDLTGLGDDFAGRGLLSSGLYAQADDEVAADYARQGSALDQSADELAKQYGKRDSVVDLSGMQKGKAPANLDSIYGLLGAMGINAGGTYNSALQKARGESAGRATSPLINTLGW